MGEMLTVMHDRYHAGKHRVQREHTKWALDTAYSLRPRNLWIRVLEREIVWPAFTEYLQEQSADDRAQSDWGKSVKWFFPLTLVGRHCETCTQQFHTLKCHFFACIKMRPRNMAHFQAEGEWHHGRPWPEHTMGAAKEPDKCFLPQKLPSSTPSFSDVKRKSHIWLSRSLLSGKKQIQHLG